MNWIRKVYNTGTAVPDHLEGEWEWQSENLEPFSSYLPLFVAVFYFCKKLSKSFWEIKLSSECIVVCDVLL